MASPTLGSSRRSQSLATKSNPQVGTRRKKTQTRTLMKVSTISPALTTILCRACKHLLTGRCEWACESHKDAAVQGQEAPSRGTRRGGRDMTQKEEDLLYKNRLALLRA